MRATGRRQAQRLTNLETVMKTVEADCDRVEFWAAAWQGLVAPVPAYETAADAFRLGRARHS